ncbi:MAG: hypothetical protein IPN76_35060 [Saprospiraceae bacterium]|nr:hypothetical protein [Saprospiraceae bacterium]
MKIYRDCYGANGVPGAPFDGDSGNNAPFPATITIYRGNSNNPFDVISIQNPTITGILPNLGVTRARSATQCMRTGRCRGFDLDLPISNESYHIVYQRCCRNGSITNLNDPMPPLMVTYYMELTAKACEVLQ